jgi:hypothetical protein
MHTKLEAQQMDLTLLLLYIIQTNVLIYIDRLS